MPRSSTTFGPNNQAARKHGARSTKTGSDTGSERVRVDTLAEFPGLQGELLERLVTARMHVRQLREYLDANGLLDGRGRPRKALDLLRAREKDVADCEKLARAGIPGAAELTREERVRIGLREIHAELGLSPDPHLPPEVGARYLRMRAKQARAVAASSLDSAT